MESFKIQNKSDTLYFSFCNLSQRQMRNSTDINVDIIGPPSYIVFTATALYCMIFLVGVLGNIIVVIVIMSSRTLKTAVNKYLLNLCIADLMVIIVCMPTALTDIFTKEVWYFGEFMCKAVPFLENTIANASVLTILAISLERFRMVCYPFKGVGENTVNLGKRIALIWAISIVSSVPWLFIAVLRPSTFYDGTPIQVCRNPIFKLWHKMYIVFLSLFFFLLPCLVLMFLYCQLCCVLGAKGGGGNHAFISENRRERKLKQNQIVNTIVSLVLIFFICHLPFRVAVLWFSFENKHVIWNLGLERFLLILYSTRIMFYSNHALNPVIYNFVSSKFRSDLRIFCRTASQKNCLISNPLNRRSSSRETFRATQYLTSNRSKRRMVKNRIVFGQLNQTGTQNVQKPKRLRVEYPCNGQISNKVVVTKYLKSVQGHSLSSSSSGDGIKVRFHIEIQNVDIKFKLRRMSSN